MSSAKRASGLSFTSRTTFGIEEEPRYDEMTDEELKSCLELSIRTNRILNLENDVFERYLARHDPQSVQAMSQVLEAAKLISSQMVQSSPRLLSGESTTGISLATKTSTPISPTSSSSIRTFSGSRGFASILTTNPSPKGLRITLSHRIEMANKEIEEMKNQLAVCEKKISAKKSNFTAELEEIELRIRDIDEAKKELEIQVVKKGADKNGKISGDKFLRFMETWIKTVDRVIDKLRLKSLTIKSQIKKARLQLRQREELGETLHLIDFQALAIENEEYLKKIDEKNKQLGQLKKITGRYNIELSNCKDRLTEQQTTLKNTLREIDVKKNQIEKLKKDLELSQSHIQQMDQQIIKVTEALEGYKMPDVIDFIRVQMELEEMKKTYKRIERHKNIQKSTLRAFKRRQSRLQSIKINTESIN
ncbi:coiled-coil domain-containing protein 113 [Microplitis demolitor]|uniref:coiled-coil domain-containing protein 113 n=1 Tax=Microplitis demolitor TaxID=69319 RepID=UPI0004CD6774|nr:coiled-coil domain-containing protein 113 [Microplitis demolitor]